ncbi:MAG: PilN domain-containing protein [Nitrospirae bacterium]|nr:PilN domain-containing protein [Nitrospirota bacterium]
MIKINLLPYKKKKKKPKPLPGFLIMCILLLAVSVTAGLIYDLYFLKSKIASLEGRKAENAKKIVQLGEKITEVQDFEKLNKQFTDRKNIIESLRKNQNLPVRILDEMSNTLTEGIWLTGMSIDNLNINIDGVGFTNPEIVAFVQKLKSSPLFTEVYLHGTTKSSAEGIEVFTFKITLQAKG